MDQYPDIMHKGRQRRNSAIVGTVRAALRQNRLLFAYQPVVSAATGIVDYFECLLRIRDEGGNILPGAEFITAVEHFGLIGLIDRFVLERAVQELGTYPQVRLGFNVSGLTACDRPWLRALSSRVRNRPDLAGRMIVEITETAALDDIEETARFVIDGSFIRNLADNPENRVFLRHLLGLTKGFGLNTIAECVESAADAALLRAEGIGYLQGYHIGAPTTQRPWLGTSVPEIA
ncbi:MAG: EAL domain-containing protein [Alphaproteobacteria bacterium]|nr:MAG: EAL domain-containing protein [Alphaproteobacteria bacterium]